MSLNENDLSMTVALPRLLHRPLSSDGGTVSVLLSMRAVINVPQDKDSLHGLPNHPVVIGERGTTLLAYCEWLTQTSAGMGGYTGAFADPVA